MGREYRISLACCVVLNEFTCQPFNANYAWFNTSDNLIIPDTSISALNTYMGAVYQQASSVVTQTSMRPFSAQSYCRMLTVIYADQEAYELTGNQYSVYGIQYQPGFDNAV